MTNVFAVSLHEIGHALAQAVLNVGPREVVIKSVDDHWEGQSLADEDANTEQKIVRLLVTQLAGPIAQIVCAPESLGNLADQFRAGLLAPCFDLYFQPDRPLNQLGWEGDLGRCDLIFLARSFQSVWHDARFHEQGGFLLHGEAALFAAFRDESLGNEMRHLANRLVETKAASRETFLADSADALKSPAWNQLRALDLTFSPPFKFR